MIHVNLIVLWWEWTDSGSQKAHWIQQPGTSGIKPTYNLTTFDDDASRPRYNFQGARSSRVLERFSFILERKKKEKKEEPFIVSQPFFVAHKLGIEEEIAHIWKCRFSKWRLVGQGERTLALTCVWPLRRLVARLVALSMVQIVPFFDCHHKQWF